MNSLTPIRVSLVRRRKRGLPLADHYGVEVCFSDGSRVVYELSADHGLQVLTPSAFAGAADVKVEATLSDAADVQAAWARLRSVAGKPDRDVFKLIGKNCENFARLVLFGESKSNQTRAAVTAGTIAGLALLLSGKK